MELKPLITVITVCYNARDTIFTTLRSVDSQDFDNYEHIIIDGASHDTTLSIVEAHHNPRRRVYSEPDKGLYDAMNKALSKVKPSYLVFLNAGDAFHGTDALSRIARAATAGNGDGTGEEPGIIYGQTVLVDKERKIIGPRHLRAPEQLSLESFQEGMVVCHQAFVALTKIIGGYNTHYRFSADYDWCIRCLQHSRRNVYLGDEPIIEYLAEGITTSHRRASLVERFKIMSHYFGFFPTLLRHIGFVGRLLRSGKGKERNR